MATVKYFEDLRVFKEARELTNLVFDATVKPPFSKDYSFVDQVRRSALSIVSNIAEGFERETRSEFARSLYIARGSCGELRAQFLIAMDRKYVSGEQHARISAACRKLSISIWKLIRYLKSPRND